MFSKRHYERIAAALAANSTDRTRLEAVRAVALDLADVFQADNARFDRERFLKAAGVLEAR